jgi:hypothetical protein
MAALYPFVLAPHPGKGRTAESSRCVEAGRLAKAQMAESLRFLQEEQVGKAQMVV